MTADKNQPISQPMVGMKLAAIAFFTGAACFFLVAALERELAPWFVLMGGLNVLSGGLMSRRIRKAAARQAAAAGDRPQASERG